MKKIVKIVFILLVISCSVYFGYSIKQPVEAQKPDIQTMLYLINQERAKVGSVPLQVDSRLNQSAQFKADDMFNNKYFDHIDKNGRHGYEYIKDYAPTLCIWESENLRLNRLSDNSSETTIMAFINSTTHYMAMINPKFTAIGMGINNNIIVHHFCQEK